MRHNIDGRKFGRNTSHRVAMLKNLANSVIEKEQVVTTLQKAKEARRLVDRLITLGKSGLAQNRRLAFDRTRDEDIVKKLFGVLAERYKDRKGGYTRVLKMADRRWGDAAQMAILELVDHPVLDRKRKVKKADEKAAGAEAEATETQAKDPFGRFRRMFGGKSKVSAGHAKAGKNTSARGAARKTPAAGGANKSGGAS